MLTGKRGEEEKTFPGGKSNVYSGSKSYLVLSGLKVEVVVWIFGSTAPYRQWYSLVVVE